MSFLTACKNDEMVIGTFQEFPPEIEGCACYFSNNEKEFQMEKYICVDDYFKNAYVIINDKKIKFKSVEASVSVKGKYKHWTKTFKSEKHQMIIEMLQTGEIDETQQQKGTITIKSNDGNQVKIPFVGECGC